MPEKLLITELKKRQKELLEFIGDRVVIVVSALKSKK